MEFKTKFRPQKYDGVSNVFAWCRQYETLCNTYKELTSDDGLGMTREALNSLEGTAREWSYTLPSTTLKWVDFKQALLSRFAGSKSQVSVQVEIAQMRVEDESILSFLQRLRSKAMECTPPLDDQQLRPFFDEVVIKSNPALAGTIIASKNATIDNLATTLNVLHTHTANTFSDVQKQTPRNKDNRDSFNRNNNNDYRNIVCYRCNKKGHTARFCKTKNNRKKEDDIDMDKIVAALAKKVDINNNNKIECEWCGRWGHDISKCKFKAKFDNKHYKQ